QRNIFRRSLIWVKARSNVALHQSQDSRAPGPRCGRGAYGIGGDMAAGVKIPLLGLLTLFFAMAANFALDQVYQVHALLLMVLAGAGFVWAVLDAPLGFTGAERTAPTGYMDDVVRAGVIATAFWGVVGFGVGTFIAFQLAFPALNFDLPWTTFGRLRPLHTSAVISAFGGNALIATSFYVVQRTSAARLWGGNLAW